MICAAHGAGAHCDAYCAGSMLHEARKSTEDGGPDGARGEGSTEDGGPDGARGEGSTEDGGPDGARGGDAMEGADRAVLDAFVSAFASESESESDEDSDELTARRLTPERARAVYLAVLERAERERK